MIGLDRRDVVVVRVPGKTRLLERAGDRVGLSNETGSVRIERSTSGVVVGALPRHWTVKITASPRGGTLAKGKATPPLIVTVRVLAPESTAMRLEGGR